MLPNQEDLFNCTDVERIIDIDIIDDVLCLNSKRSLIHYTHSDTCVGSWDDY